ncbi:DoxX family membrane protein (plasmid) [Rhodococcus sp. USK10]|uniref:DoxX family protein n=1 Tax=Rhodococcus sp. USK10 TaxID=2789739 RepID=UPI001C5EBEC8|nr:DoxX family membrane protein [Rhodococcus sp. USK10]QYA99763.1 DoxX family membrane protein [Rhodococcus sp. USK10]
MGFTVRRRNSGLEMAALLLRGVVGGTMVAHGAKHARSLDGTAAWFRSLGFQRPKLQAQASAAVEVGAGALLIAGAATPVAAAAVVGTMAVAARSVHVPNGFFIIDEGWEYVASVAAAAVAVAGLGPGRISVDHALGIDRTLSGARALVITAAVGLIFAESHLAAFWRPPRSAPSA